MAAPQATSAVVNTARSVTFQGLDSDESEVTDATEQETAPARSHPMMSHMSSRATARFSFHVLSGRSLWRFPTTDGSLPRYMQRAFRMKTFGLMAVQLTLVLGLTVLVDRLELWELMRPKIGTTSAQVIFYFIGAMNFSSILALQNYKDRYPANYVLLAVTTVMSGAFWGLTRGVTDFTIHFQILAILAFTMYGAAVVSTILTNLESKIAGSKIVAMSLLPNWMVASVVNAILCDIKFTLEPLEIVGATGFSFLLICILLVDVGKLLVRCRPDDFMSVIVAMDSTLMVVVSIPFFVLTFCFLHSGEALSSEHNHSEPRAGDFPMPALDESGGAVAPVAPALAPAAPTHAAATQPEWPQVV